MTYVDSRRIVINGEDEYVLRKFAGLNERTCQNQTPIVKPSEKIVDGQFIADGASMKNGELCLGRNVLVAFMPWEGYNFKDAIIISEDLLKKDVFTSIHIEEFDVEIRDTKLGREEFSRDIPNVGEKALRGLDDGGIIKTGTHVRPGDILVGKLTPKSKTEFTPEEKLLHAMFGRAPEYANNESLEVPSGIEGIVIGTQKICSRKSLTDYEGRAFDAEIKQIERDGDGKIAALFNPMIREMEGVLGYTLEIERPTDFRIEHLHIDDDWKKNQIERIYRKQWPAVEKAIDSKTRKLNLMRIGNELPRSVLQKVNVYIATKRPLAVGDKVADRHGNKGVIAKILPREDMPFLDNGTPVDMILNPLGIPTRMNIGRLFETHLGWAASKLGCQFVSPPFDGISEEKIKDELEKAALPRHGKVKLSDGRTGEPFDQETTVGYLYVQKLNHLVDEKVHARSTGPYSLITQQPLGGKARFGGQRFDEMDVWALEAYGAAYTLQELLTVKSDDVEGRTKIYESMVKGENFLEAGTPASFDVLVNEIRGLGLNMELRKSEDGIVCSAQEIQKPTSLHHNSGNQKNIKLSQTTEIVRNISFLRTFFLLGRENFRRFQRKEDTGCVEIFYADKANWMESGSNKPIDLPEPIIVCRSLPHNNHWSFLTELAEFVRIYQSNEHRCASSTENVWIQLDFHDLKHDGDGTFTCTETTRIVLNPFIAPRITALKATPNRPFQAFLDFHGGKSFDQKALTNFTKGSLFHEKVENHIAGTGKSDVEINHEFIMAEPWNALTADFDAFSSSDTLHKEFIAQPNIRTYSQSFRNGRLGIEIDFLNDRRGFLGKEDFVQENPDGSNVAQVIDLKSGNLYPPDRQQVYLYLDANEAGMGNGRATGRIHYYDKKEGGFCEEIFRFSDKNSVGKFRETIRGRANYDFYRNNWILQFLYASFIPELFVKTGDADYVNLSPGRPTASCAKWDQDACKNIAVQLGMIAPHESPCDKFCRAETAKRSSYLHTRDRLPHLYFKWMVSMVHKLAMLEYLEFQYCCNRSLKSLKESCRIVFNATCDKVQSGIVSFRVPKDCDHSDFCEGTGIIVVPYEVVPSPLAPNDRREDTGQPLREGNGKIRFLRGTVVGIDDSGNGFKIFEISITNPFPEHFLERYTTFSFQESSFDSSPTESQTLFQVLLTDSHKRLRDLILGETKLAECSPVDASVKKWFEALDKLAKQGLFGGKTIDTNKIKIVTEALAADTLYMIQGPPGTGKTYSIVLIALYYLIFTKKNVKIATFTNNAAKRILEELSKNEFLTECVIRDGNGVHGKDYTPFHDGAVKWAGKFDATIDRHFQLDATALTSAIEQGESAYRSACTAVKNRIRILVGTTHSLFTNSVATHDWKAEDTITIIDEASQLTEPKTLLGLANSEKFILVGDEKQLSPVVPNREEIPLFPNIDRGCVSLDTGVPRDALWEPLRKIELKSFNESLFERFLRLYSNIPGHHGQLDMIYRGPIGLYEFSNREYYHGTLQSANKESGDSLSTDKTGVVFYDVPLDSSKPRSSRRHAEFIRDNILSKFKQEEWSKISIVTLFNAQVHELRQVMPGMDIRTVDRMQGHENDLIVFDIACSTNLLQNAKGLALLDGKLVAKKLNVALTRAKKKLMIVGDRKALEADKDEFEGAVDECGSFKKMLLFLDTLNQPDV